MKREMKNKDIIKVLQGIKAIQHLGNLDFALLLKRNDKYLRDELKLVQELIPEQPKQFDKYEESAQELAESINADSKIAMADKQKVYDEKLKELAEKYEGVSDYISQTDEINEMPYEGRVHIINYKKLPVDAIKPLIDGIELIVEFEWDKEEEPKKVEEKE